MGLRLRGWGVKGDEGTGAEGLILALNSGAGASTRFTYIQCCHVKNLAVARHISDAPKNPKNRQRTCILIANAMAASSRTPTFLQAFSFRVLVSAIEKKNAMICWRDHSGIFVRILFMK